jgi:hypothetical protein
MAKTMQANNLDRGVGYYNEEELRIKKDNLLLKKENKFSSSSSDLSPVGSETPDFVNTKSPGDLGEGVVASESEFWLTESMIDRAPIQLFDNGEQAFQRYKFKIRLNLHGHDHKNSPEFIASLTKDFRNFKRYIPADCRQDIIDRAHGVRQDIKSRFGSYPYIGKLHLNQGKINKVCNQIEPWTLVAVWYDSEERGWSGVLWFHDWTYRFDLFDNNVTAKQKSVGVKASILYINPAHDQRQRPKTWAEQMQGKQ